VGNVVLRLLKKWAALITDWFESDVEEASRWEKIKRQFWMLVSTMVSLLVVFGSGGWIVTETGWRPIGILGFGYVIILLFVAVALDSWLMGWGIRRFDLVRPAEFREIEEGDS